MSPDESNKQVHWPSQRRLLIAFLVLCIVGIGLSVELSRIHYYTHTDLNYQSICSVNDKVDCKTVAQSPYSVFAGAPVSVWGILGYVIMGILAAWGSLQNRLHRFWPVGALSLMSLVSFLYSAFLAYVSLTQIDSICLFCTGLYAVNLLLVCVMAAAMVRCGGNPLSLVVEDFRSLFKNAVVLGILIGLPGAAIAAILVFIEPYWQHIGWSDLPTLPTGDDEDGRHWIGAENALVTIVEFSDYECPHCRRAHKEMRGLASKYPNSVRLIHSHLPLDHSCNEFVKSPYHLRACEFSKATECAALQNRFWEMNDAVFSAQDHMKAKDVDVESLAVRIGLDRSAFAECMGKPGIPDCIRNDMKTARRLKVPGTPTFYINSKPFTGGIPPKVLENAVQAARKNPK